MNLLIITFILLLNVAHFRVAKSNLSDQIIKFDHIDFTIDEQVKWLLQYIPIFNQNSSEHIRCLNIVLVENQNKTTPRTYHELKYIQILLKSFERFTIKISFRLNRTLESFSCDYMILVVVNNSNPFRDIQLWNNAKKFKYFLVLVPFNDDMAMITNVTFWPTNIFTNSHVIVILQRNIYLLSTPYARMPRQLNKITKHEFRDWRKIEEKKGKRLSFNGRHLKVATLDCPPNNYWRYPERGDNFLPAVGEREIICSSHIKNIKKVKCKSPDGVMALMIDELAKRLNFTWEIYYPDGDYGTSTADGMENGIVGEASKYKCLVLYLLDSFDAFDSCDSF